MRILIIGNGAAGLSAGINARKVNNNAEIIIVGKERYHSYRRPSIPSIIAGDIVDIKDAEIYSKDFLSKNRIEFLIDSEVINIKPDKKTVLLRNNITGEEKYFEYDKLIIATGGNPAIPEIKGIDKKGIMTFTTYNSAIEIVKMAVPGTSCVVVGAGFIGLEVAEALIKRGLKVYFNVRSRILRRLLETDMSEFLEKEFEKQNLIMLKGESISEIGGENNEVKYVIIKNERIDVSMVIFGTGVIPEVSLAKNCGIELGKTGAIKVNGNMETSIKDIYAAGDCAESPDLFTGNYSYNPVGSIAAMAGKIAGVNSAGQNLKTEGFIRAQADKIFGYEIVSVGHTTTTAKEVNLNVKIYDLSDEITKKQLFPQKYPVKIKVLTDEKNKIVGAQVITKKYAGQYSYKLFEAVIRGLDFKNFLDNWKPFFQKELKEILNPVKSYTSI